MHHKLFSVGGEIRTRVSYGFLFVIPLTFHGDHSPIGIPTKLYLAHTFEFPAKKGYDLGYDIYPKVLWDIDMI